MILSYQNPEKFEDCLHIIRYPYIEGTSMPSSIRHWLDIVMELQSLHIKDVVFGDIRLSNMIFKPIIDGEAIPSPCGLLIDFDLAGLESERTYPAGFNPDIDDGVRHRDAKPDSHLEKSHDCFSTAKLMERFELYITSDEDQPYDPSIWTSICCNVMSKDLATGIVQMQKLLNDHYNLGVRLKSGSFPQAQVETLRGTCSPQGCPQR